MSATTTEDEDNALISMVSLEKGLEGISFVTLETVLSSEECCIIQFHNV